MPGSGKGSGVAVSMPECRDRIEMGKYYVILKNGYSMDILGQRVTDSWLNRRLGSPIVAPITPLDTTSLTQS